MTTSYDNNSQYLEGVQTVSFKLKGSSTAVSVANVLAGQLSRRELQMLSTLGIEGRSYAFELDAADLGGLKPVQGSEITQTNGDRWRVQSTEYDDVIKVHRVACTEIK